jgi:N-methylhydantoinase A
VYQPEAERHVECPVYDRYGLKPGDVVAGPALVEEAESTCVLAAGDSGTIDAELNLVIDIAGARA